MLVLRIFMSVEGIWIVERYDHDTRPEHLHSVHTFATLEDIAQWVTARGGMFLSGEPNVTVTTTFPVPAATTSGGATPQTT